MWSFFRKILNQWSFINYILYLHGCVCIYITIYGNISSFFNELISSCCLSFFLLFLLFCLCLLFFNSSSSLCCFCSLKRILNQNVFLCLIVLLGMITIFVCVYVYIKIYVCVFVRSFKIISWIAILINISWILSWIIISWIIISWILISWIIISWIITSLIIDIKNILNL